MLIITQIIAFYFKCKHECETLNYFLMQKEIISFLNDIIFVFFSGYLESLSFVQISKIDKT